MLKPLLPNLFRIEVPLPGNPLKSINSYVVTSHNRNLVIDTGMNRSACRQALDAGFKDRQLDLTRTDFLITHYHADHIGLVADLATPSSRVFFNESEAHWIDTVTTEGFLASLLERARMWGFPENDLEDSLRQHPGIRYSSRHFPPFTILRDGETINVGEYTFTVMQTPGHSPGHLCLYEPRKRVFISGDHVLGDITPNISAPLDDTDALGAYLASLDRVRDLDVALVLPGHRTPFTDLRARIDELKHHHLVREQEVLDILENGPLTAYDVAAQMTWEIVAESWDHFPLMQKWFAVGEAAAHLIHLETQRAITKTLDNGTPAYSRTPNS